MPNCQGMSKYRNPRTCLCTIRICMPRENTLPLKVRPMCSGQSVPALWMFRSQLILFGGEDGGDSCFSMFWIPYQGPLGKTIVHYLVWRFHAFIPKCLRCWRRKLVVDSRYWLVESANRHHNWGSQEQLGRPPGVWWQRARTAAQRAVQVQIQAASLAQPAVVAAWRVHNGGWWHRVPSLTSAFRSLVLVKSMRTEIHMYYFLGEFFFATVTGFFSNSSNLTRKSVFFFRQSPRRRVFLQRFSEVFLRRGFFATVQRFFLRQFNVFLCDISGGWRRGVGGIVCTVVVVVQHMIGSSRVRVDNGWQTVSSITGAEYGEEEEAAEEEEVEEEDEEESSRRLARARGTSESDEGRRWRRLRRRRRRRRRLRRRQRRQQRRRRAALVCFDGAFVASLCDIVGEVALRSCAWRCL